MTLPRRLPGLLLGALLLAGLVSLPRARAGGEEEGSDPAPEIVVHVPADEMDVLLETDRRGIVLRHDEYQRLLAAARKTAKERGARPPVDGSLTSAAGRLDLADGHGGRLEVTYRVRVLGDGTSVVPFVVQGLAVDRIDVEGEGRYEELDGLGRLRFTGPGDRVVRVKGYVALSEKDAQRLVDVTLAPAAAMALEVALPPAVQGVGLGEGAPVSLESPPGRGETVSLRPSREGRLRVAWEPAQRGTEGPPVFDVQTAALHRVEDGLIRSRIAVHVDVLRTAVKTFELALPAAMALRAVEGQGVAGSTRSEDRERLRVELDAERRGRVTITIDAETPYEPAPGVALPRIVLSDAVRQRSWVALQVTDDVQAHAVRVEGGRRLASQPQKDAPPLLRYALAKADGGVFVDLLDGALRLEASSTYYLNLTEPAKSLLAAITYHVRQGTAFELAPRFPAGYGLRSLLVNGQATGFTFDQRSDGALEVRLERGVREGGRIDLVATLEQAAVDWVPEQGALRLPFALPASGAERESGFLGVGADASFRVLDTEVKDLVPVGAAALTARGVTPAGLVYGYRLDGREPSVLLEVSRREPRLDATVVTQALPGPRRLLVENLVVFVVERAGVRRLLVDVPSWARDVARVDAPDLVSASRVEAEGVPAGYDRWEVVLARRVLGRQPVAVRYWEDQEGDDWVVPADRPLAVTVPVERTERTVIVTRSPGLEVDLEGDVEARDLADLPPEAAVDVLSIREVVRLLPGAPGPGIRVRKHEGAPVLDAIAPLVELRTGVAREGILRTRAHVTLVNVGLQFLNVLLPPNSELIGAVVDGESVKPLTDPEGVLRIPVPPARGGTTLAALTYETRLGHAAEGDVEIPAPDFPGLEVLKTTHEVAFDPGVEIEGVEGDYGTGRRLGRKPRRPAILGIFPNLLSARVESAAGGTEAPARQVVDSVEFEGDVSAEQSKAMDARLSRAEATLNAAEGRTREMQRDADRADAEDLLRQQVAQLQELQEEVRRYRAGVVAQPQRSAESHDEAGPQTEMMEPPAPDAAPSAPLAPPGMREPTDRVPPPPAAVAPPPRPAGGLAAGGPPVARPQPGGEGPEPTPATTPAPRPPRRKGLLSLDVPVLLSPNVVRAERLGGGGSMTVALVATESFDTTYFFVGILALAAGLAFATRGRPHVWLVPLLGFVLAALIALVFGRDAGVWPAAVADAATLLVVLLLLRALVRRLIATPAKAGAAAALLAALLLAAPGRASADESREEVKVPRTVYVPYDPDDPSVPRADDRVFLPLETYLELRRLAHPDEDPDVLAQGRAVALVGANHRLRIGAEEARGVLVLGFTKRGEGLSVVPLPFTGLAVSHATLDGESMPLLLRDGVYHVPLEDEGDHLLEVEVRAPVVRDRNGRRVAFQVPPFAATVLDLTVEDFEGEVRVPGAGRVSPLPGDAPPHARVSRVYLGNTSQVEILLDDPRGQDPEVALRTRAESQTWHSIRDGGTESRAAIQLHVLQGKADHVDLDLPEGVSVLQAGGPAVARWETGGGRLRLVFAQPQEGVVNVAVTVVRSAATPTREEALPALAVRDTTGERGVIVVNADPFLRIEPTATDGLLRTATPRDDAARGPDGAGRVAGAWHFATRPTRFAVRIEEAPEGLAIDTRAAVAFGDDHVRSRFDATIRIDPRVPVGDLVFDLPGTDEVRSLTGNGVAAWWTEGEGEGRTLHIRQADLVRGDLSVMLRLERRLGGKRDAVTVPRWRLREALSDRGELQVFATSDVDPDPGRLPGLRSVPLTTVAAATPPVPGATLRRAFIWEEPTEGSLPVTLRTPPLEVDAVVVTSVHPGDETHRLEHLALFDVRRGLADQFDLFVPDGGLQPLDVIRTRDLSEVRQQRVRRRGPDGVEVDGTLYEIHVQSARSGIVEITLSRVCRPDLPIRVVRPERVAGEGASEREVKNVRWFGLVRTFLDGEVDVRPIGEAPDPADWEDLPFLPAGLERQDVHRFYSSRAPYVLAVRAERRQLKAQSSAVVRAAQADVVLGRDGDARVRVRYRLFNRRRQFLRVALPPQGVLFGVTVAGRPVKPLHGVDGELLIPVPKVPVGGAGYSVSLLYRAPAGPHFPEGELEIGLPKVEDATVDRTVVRLYAPEGYDYDVDTDMTKTDAEDVAADLAEAAVREAKDLIDVARAGTLEQRQRAATNAAILVAEANDLNLQAGSKRAALGREVQQVTQEFNEKYKSVVEDLESASREAAGQRWEVFASNAMPILSDAPSSGQAANAPMGQTRAGEWCFNPAQVDGKGKKQEIAELKQRLGKALEERSAAPMVQDFDVQTARIVAQDRNAGDDTRRNFGVLNGFLAQEQRKNRQLGVVVDAQPGATSYVFAGQQVRLDDVTNGLEDLASAGYDQGGGGTTTGAALNPSAGAFGGRGTTANWNGGFVFGSPANPYGVPFQAFPDVNADGASADSGIFYNDAYDGVYQARVQNMYGYLISAGDGDNGSGRIGAGGGAGGRFAGEVTRGQARQGLMGVDVPLPKEGRVFLFRSLKDGAPLRITVSEQGTSPFLRWVIFLACLGALAAGLVGLRRLRRRN